MSVISSVLFRSFFCLNLIDLLQLITDGIFRNRITLTRVVISSHTVEVAVEVETDMEARNFIPREEALRHTRIVDLMHNDVKLV